MAGFSNIGESGYQIAPPTLGQPTGSSGFLGLSIPHPIRQYSPYFNPSAYQMPGQGESGNRHEANVYLSRMGLGDTGQQRTPGYADYGFTSDDWNNILRFISNPQSNQNVQGYQGISNRMTNMTNTNPYFSLWEPSQRQNFARDFPLNLMSGFNMVPPPMLQNQQIGGHSTM